MARKVKGDLGLRWDMAEYFKGLDQYPEAVERGGIIAGKLIAMDGLGRMIEAAPVLTGLLRGSASAHLNGKFFSASNWETEAMTNVMTGTFPGGRKKAATVIVWGLVGMQRLGVTA